jgi:hypothetical protein
VQFVQNVEDIFLAGEAELGHFWKHAFREERPTTLGNLPVAHMDRDLRKRPEIGLEACIRDNSAPTSNRAPERSKVRAKRSSKRPRTGWFID